VTQNSAEQSDHTDALRLQCQTSILSSSGSTVNPYERTGRSALSMDVYDQHVHLKWPISDVCQFLDYMVDYTKQSSDIGSLGTFCTRLREYQIYSRRYGRNNIPQCGHGRYVFWSSAENEMEDVFGVCSLQRIGKGRVVDA
jgi:hypothetical protein